MEMTQTRDFHGQEKKAMIALKFGESSRRLLRSMQSFYQKTSMSIRAVHVIDEFGGEGGAYSDFFGFEKSPVFRRCKEKAFAAADARLKELLTECGFSESERHVTYNMDVGRGLLDEMENCALAVLGTGQESSPMIPKTFSTVLSVMAGSSIPTLIVKWGGILDFSREQRVLLLDDFSFHCQSILESAFAFSAAIGARELLHAHFRERAERSKPDLEESLKLRARTARDRLSVGSCRYSAFVSDERFHHGLPLLQRDFHPTITVLGRRETERFLLSGSAVRNFHLAFEGSQAILLMPPC